jgi:CYTH domain-containing protein
MDKTYKTEIFRIFLIEAIPEPLSRSSSHLQIFDNYIANTRMRIRSIRVPETKEWTYLLQQRFRINSQWRVGEIHLDEAEHAQFEIFDGIEIRKNRYFHEFDSRMFVFDVYLGPLWGLNRVRVDFEGDEDLLAFQPPPFAIYEITSDPFFDDANLVTRSLDDVRNEIEKLTPIIALRAAPDQ